MSIPLAGPLTHTLRMSDSLSPDKRGKPAGVVGAQVFVQVGLEAGVDPAQATFQRFVSRVPQQIGFGAGDRGKMATYSARWQTSTGLVGLFSTAVTMAIP